MRNKPTVRGCTSASTTMSSGMADGHVNTVNHVCNVGSLLARGTAETTAKRYWLREGSSARLCDGSQVGGHYGGLVSVTGSMGPSLSNRLAMTNRSVRSPSPVDAARFSITWVSSPWWRYGQPLASATALTIWAAPPQLFLEAYRGDEVDPRIREVNSPVKTACPLELGVPLRARACLSRRQLTSDRNLTTGTGGTL